MKNHKIEFKFIENRFNYELPLVGVDTQFLIERRKEIHFCLAQLSEKIGQINIACAKGVEEFNKANKLVKWYWLALSKINHKYKLLTGAYPKEEATKEQEEWMRNQYREKTR